MAESDVSSEGNFVKRKSCIRGMHFLDKGLFMGTDRKKQQRSGVRSAVDLVYAMVDVIDGLYYSLVNPN